MLLILNILYCDTPTWFLVVLYVIVYGALLIVSLIANQPTNNDLLIGSRVQAMSGLRWNEFVSNIAALTLTLSLDYAGVQLTNKHWQE